jgi:hypothetical protein
MERHFDNKALYYAARVLLNPKASLTEDEEEVVISALEDDLGVETEIDWSDRVLSDMLINMHMKEKGINPMNKRTHMRFIVDSYEKEQQQQPQRTAKRGQEYRPEQSASDNIECVKVADGRRVFIDPFLTSGGVSISANWMEELYMMKKENEESIILKLYRTDPPRYCFARPYTDFDRDNKYVIGLSDIVAEELEMPKELSSVSICSGFPVIKKVVVTGEGAGDLDRDQISAQVTKLEILFIGLRLFKKRISIFKLYDENDKEMDVGKIPFGETEIPIEIENATAAGGVSINRRMPQRFQNRRKINWF